MDRRAAARRQVRGGEKVKKQKKTESLATVTPLVQSIFDSMFQGQIDEKGTQQKKRRCGICEVQGSQSPGKLQEFCVKPGNFWYDKSIYAQFDVVTAVSRTT